MPGFKRYLLRCMLLGALVILAAGPILGVFVLGYRGLITGDRDALGGALVLLIVPPLAGACGGAAFGLVARGHTEMGWRLYAALVAAIEGYLAVLSLFVVFSAFLDPAFVDDLPATDVWFHAGLHGYGIGLVTVVCAMMAVVVKLRGRRVG